MTMRVAASPYILIIIKAIKMDMLKQEKLVIVTKNITIKW